jgi:transposase InsO family protein
MEAVRMVRAGEGVRKVARHFGYTPGAVSKWLERARNLPSNASVIPTRSSRPHHHPHELPLEIVSRILTIRGERNQCAEIIHYRLKEEGILVSLSSVKRTLRRCGLSRFSRWKKWHQSPPRPIPEKPGILVEIDTIADGSHLDRLYVYTLLDVCSRWTHAVPCLEINTHRSLRFVESARTVSPFLFQTLQSDHGPEFSKWFTKRIVERGLGHRHSRVRMPSDNGHLERFNRTLQEECLARVPRSLRSWQKEIPEYLRYYNEERPHMGLGMKTPIDILKVFPSY